ncbi:unnamed protein product [Vitrella brassicaformis CCMP3155]|uniref:Uncharacterized protein n=5 Tax=Vitrella brassicaformis TaxID=1169539 RepID=A0A0G4GQG4_VITBC|nr:unnamed protein product [Vitrella brassicaformis CCMP3155]|eukprot:CEM32463.1 unnamed protein product [Vitrella brassicaformis CCMP3155]
MEDQQDPNRRVTDLLAAFTGSGSFFSSVPPPTDPDAANSPPSPSLSPSQKEDQGSFNMSHYMQTLLEDTDNDGDEWLGSKDAETGLPSSPGDGGGGGGGGGAGLLPIGPKRQGSVEVDGKAGQVSEGWRPMGDWFNGTNTIGRQDADTPSANKSTKPDTDSDDAHSSTEGWRWGVGSGSGQGDGWLPQTIAPNTHPDPPPPPPSHNNKFNPDVAPFVPQGMLNGTTTPTHTHTYPHAQPPPPPGPPPPPPSHPPHINTNTEQETNDDHRDDEGDAGMGMDAFEHSQNATKEDPLLTMEDIAEQTLRMTKRSEVDKQRFWRKDSVWDTHHAADEKPPTITTTDEEAGGGGERDGPSILEQKFPQLFASKRSEVIALGPPFIGPKTADEANLMAGPAGEGDTPRMMDDTMAPLSAGPSSAAGGTSSPSNRSSPPVPAQMPFGPATDPSFVRADSQPIEMFDGSTTPDAAGGDQLKGGQRAFSSLAAPFVPSSMSMSSMKPPEPPPIFPSGGTDGGAPFLNHTHDGPAPPPPHTHVPQPSAIFPYQSMPPLINGTPDGTGVPGGEGPGWVGPGPGHPNPPGSALDVLQQAAMTYEENPVGVATGWYGTTVGGPMAGPMSHSEMVMRIQALEEQLHINAVKYADAQQDWSVKHKQNKLQYEKQLDKVKREKTELQTKCNALFQRLQNQAAAVGATIPPANPPSLPDTSPAATPHSNPQLTLDGFIPPPPPPPPPPEAEQIQPQPNILQELMDSRERIRELEMYIRNSRAGRSETTDMILRRRETSMQTEGCGEGYNMAVQTDGGAGVDGEGEGEGEREREEEARRKVADGRAFAQMRGENMALRQIIVESSSEFQGLRKRYEDTITSLQRRLDKAERATRSALTLIDTAEKDGTLSTVDLPHKLTESTASSPRGGSSTPPAPAPRIESIAGESGQGVGELVASLKGALTSKADPSPAHNPNTQGGSPSRSPLAVMSNGQSTAGRLVEAASSMGLVSAPLLGSGTAAIPASVEAAQQQKATAYTETIEQVRKQCGECIVQVEKGVRGTTQRLRKAWDDMHLGPALPPPSRTATTTHGAIPSLPPSTRQSFDVSKTATDDSPAVASVNAPSPSGSATHRVTPRAATTTNATLANVVTEAIPEHRDEEGSAGAGEGKEGDKNGAGAGVGEVDVVKKETLVPLVQGAYSELGKVLPDIIQLTYILKKFFTESKKMAKDVATAVPTAVVLRAYTTFRNTEQKRECQADITRKQLETLIRRLSELQHKVWKAQTDPTHGHGHALASRPAKTLPPSTPTSQSLTGPMGMGMDNTPKSKSAASLVHRHVGCGYGDEGTRRWSDGDRDEVTPKSEPSMPVSSQAQPHHQLQRQSVGDRKVGESETILSQEEVRARAKQVVETIQKAANGTSIESQLMEACNRIVMLEVQLQRSVDDAAMVCRTSSLYEDLQNAMIQAKLSEFDATTKLRSCIAELAQRSEVTQTTHTTTTSNTAGPSASSSAAGVLTTTTTQTTQTTQTTTQTTTTLLSHSSSSSPATMSSSTGSSCGAMMSAASSSTPKAAELAPATLSSSKMIVSESTLNPGAKAFTPSGSAGGIDILQKLEMQLHYDQANASPPWSQTFGPSTEITPSTVSSSQQGSAATSVTSDSQQLSAQTDATPSPGVGGVEGAKQKSVAFAQAISSIPSPPFAHKTADGVMGMAPTHHPSSDDDKEGASDSTDKEGPSEPAVLSLPFLPPSAPSHPPPPPPPQTNGKTTTTTTQQQQQGSDSGSGASNKQPPKSNGQPRAGETKIFSMRGTIPGKKAHGTRTRHATSTQQQNQTQQSQSPQQQQQQQASNTNSSTADNAVGSVGQSAYPPPTILKAPQKHSGGGRHHRRGNRGGHNDGSQSDNQQQQQQGNNGRQAGK